MSDILKEYPFKGRLSFKPLIDYLFDEDERKPCKAKLFLKESLKGEIEKAPELLEPIDDFTVLEKHAELIQKLMSVVMAPASLDREAIAAVVPFSVRPIFVSPLFQQLFLDSEGVFQGRINVSTDVLLKGRVIRSYLFILERFYGIRQNLDYPIVRIIRDPENGLDRYFNMTLDFRFVDCRALKKPKVLTEKDRNRILEHLTEPEVLKEILPPSHFELHGFTLIRGTDVTKSEVISALERDLISQESIVSPGEFDRIQGHLRTLFRRPDLVSGVAAFQGDQILMLSKSCEKSCSCIFADSHHVPVSEMNGTVFDRAVRESKVVRVPDLQDQKTIMHKEEGLLQMGLRSLLIAPLFHKDKPIGTMYIASPRPGDLGSIDAMLLDSIRPMFAMSIKKALDDLEHRVQGVIKEKCTAIHPTVEWRFRKAALKHFEDIRAGRPSQMEQIVFKDIFPLYGVSDIRGSTTERNRAIQDDLAMHLELALNVVQSANEAKPLFFLNELIRRIEQRRDRIKNGLVTGDEHSILKFLREDVESLFPHLREFGVKVIRAVEAYESAIDPNVNTVYRLRKEFEDSVFLLNERLMTYLDHEQAELQSVFPHYFERRRTDGVDYLIYIGPSLVENGEFNEIYLKNLRLWQLKVACGMIRLTEQLKPEMKVPLDTAHLILVQDTPLSIQFRFDEKRFGVDGAYDTRHEIIKSRIDKAVVKDTGERLTQPGKIAVVYSHPNEAWEMRRHIDFLQSEGYLTDELELLDLDDMPGVHGLKALRVGVDPTSQVLADHLPVPADEIIAV